MQDELEDNNEDYQSILDEEWCLLLSTIEVKENWKSYAVHIKRLSSSKKAPVNSDINESVMVTRKKKASTGVLPNHKHHGKKTPKHHGYQRYQALCKKA